MIMIELKYLRITLAILFWLLVPTAMAAKSAQTISFDLKNIIAVGSTGTLVATASSGLPVKLTTATAKVCSVNGNQVKGIGANLCTISASQAGNVNFNPVVSSVSFAVSKANQSISFSTTPVIIFGGSGSLSAKASSGLTVSLSSATADICSIKNGTVKGLAAGTCIIAANQAGDANTVAAPQAELSFNIGKAAQTLQFASHPALTVSSTANLSATASSGLIVNYTTTTPNICTVNANVVSGITVGLCSIKADQSGNSNYKAASQASQSFNIGKGKQIISFGSPPSLIIIHDNQVSATSVTGTVSAKASSGLTVSLSSSTPAICSITANTVTAIAAGTCNIVAHQAGNANYSSATVVSQSFPVTASTNNTTNTPEIVLLAPSSINTLSVAWLPASMSISADQVSYSIYLSTSNNFSPNLNNLKSTVVGKTQATLTQLDAGTTYFLLVVANDNLGHSISGTRFASTSTYAVPPILNSTILITTSLALNLGLHSQIGNNFTYNKAINTKSLPVNSLLISQGSDGYQLLTVNAVKVSGSKTTVTTSPAALSDALTSATVASNLLLFDVSSNASTNNSSSNLSTQRYSQLKWANQLLAAEQTDHATQARQISSMPTDTVGQHTVRLGNQADAATVSPAVSLTETVSFSPSLQIQLSWTADGLVSGSLVATGDLNLDLNAVYNFQTSGSYTPDPIVLTTKTYTSVFNVGTVPVYQDVTLTISAKISASATNPINASTHTTASETLSFGASYNPTSHKWQALLTENGGQSLTAQLNVNGDVQAQVHIIPEIQVKFYQVSAATMSVDPYTDVMIGSQTISSNPVLQASLPALQPSEFDVNLDLKSYVTSNFNSLWRNDTSLASSLTGNSTALFSLPVLQLQAPSNAIVGANKNLTLNVSNGINDSFNPQSIQWQAIADNTGNQASVTPIGCTPSNSGYTCAASLNAQNADSYNIIASGYGSAGARQYALSLVNASVCQIGKGGPAGGIVFYCDNTGIHGLEVSAVDQTPSTWGCWKTNGNDFTYTAVGITGSAIGTGSANTAAILAVCGTAGGAGDANPSNPDGGTQYNAAATAAAYSLNGYTDWFLPSESELNQLLINQPLIPVLLPTTTLYWSSTEIDSNSAWTQVFFNPNYNAPSAYVKYVTTGVRAIRAF